MNWKVRKKQFDTSEASGNISTTIDGLSHETEATDHDMLKTHPEVSPHSTPEIEDLALNDPPLVPIISNKSSNFESFEPRKSLRAIMGIPKKQYEPDTKAQSKYAIANFISNHRLSNTHALAINQLSTVSIPNSVQEALKNPNWKAAMNEELQFLRKNATWEIVQKPTERILLDVVVCLM